MKTSTLIALLAALCLPATSAPIADYQAGPAQVQTPKKDPKKKITKKKKAKNTKAKASAKPKTKPKAPVKKKTTKATTKAKKTPAKHLTPATPALMKKATTLVKGMSTTSRSKFLKLLNKGTPTELSKVKGIGPVKAANIKKARPFKKVEELANVTGFGEKTFKEVITSAKSLK